MDTFQKPVIINKLVRNKIPQLIEANGNKCVTRSLEDKELYSYLLLKFDEEFTEFKETPNPEELADILEVFRSLCYAINTTPEIVENVRINKTAKNGSFSEGILLERYDNE